MLHICSSLFSIPMRCHSELYELEKLIIPVIVSF